MHSKYLAYSIDLPTTAEAIHTTKITSMYAAIASFAGVFLPLKLSAFSLFSLTLHKFLFLFLISKKIMLIITNSPNPIAT